MSTVPGFLEPAARVRSRRFERVAARLRYPLAVYLASRVLYLIVAVINIPLRNAHLGQELRNWDGKWYVLLAEHGYPHVLPTHYGGGAGGWSTLGFEPLYSMLMWLGGEILPRGVEASGLLISLICGGIATVELTVLAERWWGPTAARRAILFFCFFPGTIVFSMVYSEGLTLALVAGAFLCLEDRRWVFAGLLAGAATAIEPTALAIIPACAAVSARELWRRGWRDRDARRSLWAPVLSVYGAVGVAIFSWAWTGTPTAILKTQRIAWGEHSSLLSIYYDARAFIKSDLIRWHGIGGLNLNYVVGVVGAFFLIWGFTWLWRLRDGAPVEPEPGMAGVAGATRLARIGTGVTLAPLVWTIVVAYLTLSSEQTPPNPRMLIVAFPVVLAVAATRTGRRQRILLGVSLVILVAMSIGSFAYGGLRP